jgi:hypothetical protein
MSDDNVSKHEHRVELDLGAQSETSDAVTLHASSETLAQQASDEVVNEPGWEWWNHWNRESYQAAQEQGTDLSQRDIQVQDNATETGYAVHDNDHTSGIVDVDEGLMDEIANHDNAEWSIVNANPELALGCQNALLSSGAVIVQGFTGLAALYRIRFVWKQHSAGLITQSQLAEEVGAILGGKFAAMQSVQTIIPLLASCSCIGLLPAVVIVVATAVLGRKFGETFVHTVFEVELSRDDYHDVLRVHQQEMGDLSIIKRRYRELALLHHPDKGGDTVQDKELNEAYNELLLHLGQTKGLQCPQT